MPSQLAEPDGVKRSFADDFGRVAPMKDGSEAVELGVGVCAFDVGHHSACGERDTDEERVLAYR